MDASTDWMIWIQMENWTVILSLVIVPTKYKALEFFSRYSVLYKVKIAVWNIYKQYFQFE